MRLIPLVLIALLACEKNKPEPLCTYDYQITITNVTELKIEESTLIQNNNPSCCVEYDQITCNNTLNNLDYTLLDIDPLSTIQLTGTATHNCESEQLCGGYVIFEINEILNPNIEFTSSNEVPPPSREQLSIASRSTPTIQLILQYKSFEFELEVDNQTDSIAFINYSTLLESCHPSGIEWIEIEPKSLLSSTLSTANLGGNCEFRYGSYNFRIFLIRNDTWPVEVFEIVKPNQKLKYTVTLDSLGRQEFIGNHW